MKAGVARSIDLPPPSSWQSFPNMYAKSSRTWSGNAVECGPCASPHPEHLADTVAYDHLAAVEDLAGGSAIG